jgi:hypothetical protein
VKSLKVSQGGVESFFDLFYLSWYLAKHVSTFAYRISRRVVGLGLELSVFWRIILGIKGDHLGSRFQAEHLKGDVGSEATCDIIFVAGAGLIA